ncbi:hypothetical protein CNA02205 [Cryptococcus deneoformans JEC21]|uniref:Uncharacterized protein n=1 Tax=Cryptococcus deneoformans (strain JEC21 / ATCC MYA-565) TaxID=214684 RepID=A0A0S2LIF6_CRYD1|nr:hypothetical protein CNA02205 [Cryptococcus neoformans var. neoformans JEC21]ALO60302.1 hypothetical protein CNA02205 [Cryptococcus neoformans var. neoformans JEC21]
MGPIVMQLADLPNQYRSQFLYTMLMGITPAPREPPSCFLHRLLLPLAVELLSAHCDGLWVKTPKYPEGRLILSALARFTVTDLLLWLLPGALTTRGKTRHASNV